MLKACSKYSTVARLSTVHWRHPNPNTTKEIIGMKRPTLRKLVNVFTDHTVLRIRVSRIELSNDTICRTCGEKDE